MDNEVIEARKKIKDDLLKSGVREGACILVHSSLSKLGLGQKIPGGADTVIDALIDAVGPRGTVCFPTLSYLFTTEKTPIFDVRNTPSNVGIIPETFRRRPNVVRSVHPTHSVAAFGAQAEFITKDHWKDRTPVGPNSPFRRIYELSGQILFLGCTPRCNTSIHGVEELLPKPPPFLFQEFPIVYSVVDYSGNCVKVEHKRHNFEGIGQRYERVANILEQNKNGYSEGTVFNGKVFILDAKPMWDTALEHLLKNPFCFVDSVGEGEDHFLIENSSQTFSYVVGPKKISS